MIIEAMLTDTCNTEAAKAEQREIAMLSRRSAPWGAADVLLGAFSDQRASAPGRVRPDARLSQNRPSHDLMARPRMALVADLFA